MSGEHYNADYDDGGEASKPKYALRRQGAIGRALKAVSELYAGRRDPRGVMERSRARARILGGMFTISELYQIEAEADAARLGVK